MIGNEQQQQPDASNATRRLIKTWPNYQKPIDAHSLISKFSLDDLIRVAKVDSDLKNSFNNYRVQNRKIIT